MKQTLLKLTALLTIALAISGWPLTVLADGSGSITVSANRATVANGGSLIVAIYMNGGGTPIYGVQADISYPTSKLQYVGFSASGGAFEIAATNGGSDGLASIARGTTSPVSGSALIGTATFRALVGSGSATIAVAGSSSLAKGDGTALSITTGSDSVNFGAAAVATPSAPAAAAPSAPVVPEPPKDTTPPVITALKIKSLTPYTAVISWSTNEPANAAVDYGVDSNYGLSASQADVSTNHQVALGSAFLVPKSVVHYRVKSADAAGNVQTGSDQTLTLPGVPVTVVVRGDNGQPESGAVVTLDSQTTTTNAKGQANFTAGLGTKQMVVTYGGVTVRQPVAVTRSTKPLPPVQLDLAKQPLNHWMVTSIGLIVLVLTLLGLDVALFGSTFINKLIAWRRRGNSLVKATPLTGSDVPAATPVPLAATLLPSGPVPISAQPGAVPLVASDINTAKIDSLAVPAANPTAPVLTPARQIIITDQPETAAATVAKRLKPRPKTAKPKKTT